MGRGVIYARYSDHKQNETSIEDQIRVCQNAAQQRGDIIVRVYEDRSRSGRGTDNRPQFLKMISDAEKGLWKAVYVYKIDRFARDRYDAAVFRKKLKDQGIKLVSATEPTLDGPEGAIMDAMLDGFAEYWSLVMSANIKRGMEGNALRCHHNGVSLYGYDLGADGRYLINEGEATIIRMCFELYAEGKSTGDIARALEPYRTRRGRPWKAAQVVKILHNEKYAGTYIFGEHRIEGGMPAIVTREMFDEVNSMMNKPRNRDMDFPLTGILYDPEGNSYCGTSGTSRSGKRHYYYAIGGTRNRIPKAYIEANVYGAVSDFLQSDGVEDRVVEQMLAAQENAYPDEDAVAEALRSRLTSIERETGNLLSLAAKMGPTDQITAKMRDLEDERQAVEQEIVDARISSPKMSESQIRFFLHKIITCEAPTEALASLVSRVVLDGNTITVTFAMDSDGTHVGSDASLWSRQDSENPSVPAGREGCSHRYVLVDRWIVYSNTGPRLFLLLVGSTWFGFSARLLPFTA